MAVPLTSAMKQREISFAKKLASCFPSSGSQIHPFSRLISLLNSCFTSSQLHVHSFTGPTNLLYSNKVLITIKKKTQKNLISLVLLSSHPQKQPTFSPHFPQGSRKYSTLLVLQLKTTVQSTQRGVKLKKCKVLVKHAKIKQCLQP